MRLVIQQAKNKIQNFKTCSRSFLAVLFIRFAGASYGWSVNICSGTVGDRQVGLHGYRFNL